MSGLGPGRNLEQGAAVDGGDLDLGSQSRFRGGYRHGDANVVPFALEDRVVGGPDDHVKIAGLSSVGPRVALAGEADTLAVARAGLDADFERFCPFDRTLAMAIGTG